MSRIVSFPTSSSRPLAWLGAVALSSASCAVAPSYRVEPAPFSPPAAQSSAFVPGWCVSLAGGITCVDSYSGNFPENDVDETDTGFGASVGYQPLPWLSVELGYQDLGKEVYTDRSEPPFVYEGETKTSGYSASLLGHYPLAKLSDAAWIARIEALARLGVFSWEAKDKGTTIAGGGGDYSEKETGTDLTYGLGLQSVVLEHLIARVEWNHIDGADFDNYWLGLLWTF